jgi:hypothetical protein
MPGNLEVLEQQGKTKAPSGGTAAAGTSSMHRMLCCSASSSPCARRRWASMRPHDGATRNFRPELSATRWRAPWLRATSMPTQTTVTVRLGTFEGSGCVFLHVFLATLRFEALRDSLRCLLSESPLCLHRCCRLFSWIATSPSFPETDTHSRSFARPCGFQGGPRTCTTPASARRRESSSICSMIALTLLSDLAVFLAGLASS